MLQISASKIAHIVSLAHEMRMTAEEYEVLTEDLSEDEQGQPTSMDGSELAEFIDDLNEDEQIDLVCVAWIGRESFTADELEEARETARNEATTATSSYLMGMPHLADHLENGLDALGLEDDDDE
ncbi:DUF3775 domain-containing protein [Donghicola tyrosinivorans]|uniref:Uncharacterized protein DUF3775 n=1 Tax=Donghicola tyrosinivorans TaxID=1652492 RepID=A0A2T0WYR1_9RHOB|nr:DUF3775 domain-containing protein [Donghicola tyrosinivorans]MEC9198112.1 DUF3775 domain-containing protein [Pseudomonadota bacterium]MEE3072588.1 DUF3775 domain-containing protein [Pseudomonadota bacterium]PRY91832.1 uncharacterized protein DUF3775 [Donghicola tyrosinivorans]